MDKEEELKALGNIIKDLRIKAGLSQDQLAQKAGFKHKSSISKIESGSSDILPGKIRPISAALGVDPAVLLSVRHELKDSPAEPLSDQIRGQYGDGVLTLFELITRLDPEDRAELRGMARLMLMDKKYSEKNTKRA